MQPSPFYSSCPAIAGGKQAINPNIQPSEQKIVGVVTKPDGTKELSIILRVINKKIVFDSVEKKDVITIDTIFGAPKYYQIDTANKYILDSLKQPIPTSIPNNHPIFVAISKDSINWRVEGKGLDVLLRKDSLPK